jgi:hypothetical protein
MESGGPLSLALSRLSLLLFLRRSRMPLYFHVLTCLKLPNKNNNVIGVYKVFSSCGFVDVCFLIKCLQISSKFPWSISFYITTTWKLLDQAICWAQIYPEVWVFPFI